jgi:phage terminase large subunit GpA-like protein
MKPSRVGWSAYVKLAVQLFVDLKRAKIMIIQPTEKEAIDYAAEDIDCMFDPVHGVPCLKGLMGSRKTTKGGLKVTALFKQLVNGALIHLVNAATPRSARRVARNPIFAEEPAAYDSPEGDTLQNFFQRAGTFPDPFFTIGGTPIYPNDYMEQAFKKGDQQYRYYPCIHCGHYQQLRWEQFVIDGLYEGQFQCENCGGHIEYKHLRRMDDHAGWACPLGLDRSNQILKDGFPSWWSPHVGPGMSYHPAAAWPELVKRYKYALAQLKIGNPDPMQTFHNTDRGIPWEDSIAGKLTADGLTARRNNTAAGNGYTSDSIPAGVLLITIGVDVQGGDESVGQGLHVHIWGWGRGEESWHIAFHEIECDPAREGELARALEPLRAITWRREDGAELQWTLGIIDEGGNATEEVRRFCALNVGRWAPVKGMPGEGLKAPAIISNGKAVAFTGKNKAANNPRRDLLNYHLGYDRSVTMLKKRLSIENPGPGYIHFGTAATDSVLAEMFPWKRVYKNRGRTQQHWVKPRGERDEAGDCWRMAYAGLLLVQRRYNSATMWDQLESAALATRAGQPVGLTKSSLLKGLRFR